MIDRMDEVVAVDGDWGKFLAPDPALADIEDLHEKLGIQIMSGHRADLCSFAGANATFDRIATAVSGANLVYEDQCTARHYFDVFGCVERFCEHATEKSQSTKPRSTFWDRLYSWVPGKDVRPSAADQETFRIVDVGVFMGGSASVLAGCVESMDVELDLVDINQTYLQFAYERLRRIFPHAASKVRMFYGDLPTYVQNVLLAEEGVRTLVHHDGAHDFCQVVKDLSALYFVRDRVHGLAIQDTHLRCSNVEFFNFVDAAVYAVFGVDVRYDPLGTVYEPDSPLLNPNQYFGNYFMAGQPEGMYISFAQNEFRYPHPTMALESFLPAQARRTA